MPSSPKKKRFFNIGSVFNPKNNTSTGANANTNTNTHSPAHSANTAPHGTHTPANDPLELTASPSPSNDLLSGPKTTTTTSDTPVLADFGKNKSSFRNPNSPGNSNNPFANLSEAVASSSYTNTSANANANAPVPTSPSAQNNNPFPIPNAALRLDIAPATGPIEQVRSPSTPYNNQGLAVEEFFHDCAGPSHDIGTEVTNTNAHDASEAAADSNDSGNNTPPQSPMTGSTSPDMGLVAPKRGGSGMRSASAATLHTDTAGQREVDQLEGMDEEDSQMLDAYDGDSHDNGDANEVTPEPSAGNEQSTAGGSGGLPTSSQSDSATSAISNTSASASASASAPSAPSEPQVPSIRLTPVIDHSTSTPAQYFGPIERRLTTGSIRIGRQTESKDEPQLSQYERPIVFKSKVVSRSHAEFFVKDDQWFVQDMRSSSGTFLNRRRLSEAGKPSKPHVLKNGDMLQFGMDFRGGTEEIFKCIKVRVETNHSWKRKVQQYNIEAVERLRGIANGDSGDAECAICLVAVGPCQPLFIAPCSHAWHYKCIRPLMVKTYPHFQCPNCRNICDLEADADESMVMGE